MLHAPPPPSSSSSPGMAAPSSGRPRPGGGPGGCPSPPPCKHSPSATLDLLILILVLCSCAFLLASSLSYIARALPLLLPTPRDSPAPYFFFAALLLAAAALASCGRPCPWPRRCGKPRCRGLRRAVEFDVQLQTEECVRTSAASEAWREIDGLPWKGGQGGNNPDYECLRQELRRLAPPHGRAVLLFHARCGCPIAKLEAWGPKRGRRHKKAMTNLAIEGGVR